MRSIIVLKINNGSKKEILICLKLLEYEKGMVDI